MKKITLEMEFLNELPDEKVGKIYSDLLGIVNAYNYLALQGGVFGNGWDFAIGWKVKINGEELVREKKEEI